MARKAIVDVQSASGKLANRRPDFVVLPDDRRCDYGPATPG